MSEPPFIAELRIVLEKLDNPPLFVTPSSSAADYEDLAFCNNTKFQFRPYAFVLPTDIAHVCEVVKFANQHPLDIELRVRSGGHDHEGESSGTDCVVIDFRRMKTVCVQSATDAVPGDTASEMDDLKIRSNQLISIQPGATFTDITKALEGKDVAIPHGACSNVGIAGYTLGGGWGTWTRAKGMACESLVGAVVVLGDGSTVNLGVRNPSPTQRERDLLWALCGGGGFSFGIVTEFVFEAIDLTMYPNLCTFTLDCQRTWPTVPTRIILQCWMNSICAENRQLLGTNIYIEPEFCANVPDDDVVLKCLYFGFFSGDTTDVNGEVENMIKEYFDEAVRPYEANSTLLTAPLTAETAPVRALSVTLSTSSEPLGASSFDHWERKPTAGLKGLNPYVTLGAITGPYYQTYDINHARNTAFPYKDSLFTIQYQAWWNQYWKRAAGSTGDVLLGGGLPIIDIEKGILTGDDFPGARKITSRIATAAWKQDEPNGEPNLQSEAGFRAIVRSFQSSLLPPQGALPDDDPPPGDTLTIAVRKWTNQAEDWIASCRDFPIPNTHGAFISFKDSSVRTEVYFSQSYDELKRVKSDHVHDDNILFQTNKTII